MPNERLLQFSCIVNKYTMWNTQWDKQSPRQQSCQAFWSNPLVFFKFSCLILVPETLLLWKAAKAKIHKPWLSSGSFWNLQNPHDQPIKGLRLGFCHRVADANITINPFPGNSAMIQKKIVPVCGSNEDLSQGLSRWLHCAPSTCCVLVNERVRERERERRRPSGSTQRQDFARSVQRAGSSQLTKEQKSDKQNK